jgi:hypothetical protein
MKKHEIVVHAAARLEAVAQVCGLQPLTLRPEGRDGCALIGTREGRTWAVQVSGIGTRSTRSTVTLQAAGTPVELSLRPELPGERLDKALGMTVDVEVGDRDFDARFVVEAAPVEAARKVLPPSVRGALLAFPHDDDSPRLRLGDGRASLSWSREPDPTLLLHALTALAELVDEARSLHEGLRDVGAGHAFRQDGGDAQKVDPREREAARSRFKGAKARAVVVIGSAVAAGLGFIATVILGHAA